MERVKAVMAERIRLNTVQWLDYRQAARAAEDQREGLGKQWSRMAHDCVIARNELLNLAEDLGFGTQMYSYFEDVREERQGERQGERQQTQGPA